MFENEIPKYRKRKKSSISKGDKKSNHKHKYIDCLLVYDGKPYKSEYCEVCGKIGKINFFEMLKDEDGGRSRLLINEELYDKHKDLKTLEVESLFEKYVSI